MGSIILNSDIVCESFCCGGVILNSLWFGLLVHDTKIERETNDECSHANTTKLKPTRINSVVARYARACKTFKGRYVNRMVNGFSVVA